MKKTIFEEMGGDYIRHGDYLIPCLTLPEEEEQRFIGIWGQRHKRYLKEHKRAVYITLLTSGRLNNYLADIEEQAQERFEKIVEQMKQAQGITEQLKEENQMEWVRIFKKEVSESTVFSFLDLVFYAYSFFPNYNNTQKLLSIISYVRDEYDIFSKSRSLQNLLNKYAFVFENVFLMFLYHLWLKGRFTILWNFDFHTSVATVYPFGLIAVTVVVAV